MICNICGDKPIRCDHCLLAEAQAQLQAADALAKAITREINEFDFGQEILDALAAYEKARGLQ